jgi:hypothetical protein
VEMGSDEEIDVSQEEWDSGRRPSPGRIVT